MARRMYVRLHQPEIEALMRLAQAERRHPADQAAVLLARALRVSDTDRQAEHRRADLAAIEQREAVPA